MKTVWESNVVSDSYEKAEYHWLSGFTNGLQIWIM